MTLKCQDLERNGIENETFECILIPPTYWASLSPLPANESTQPQN